MKVLSSIVWLVLVLAVVALPSSRAFAEDRPPRADVSASAQTDTHTTTVSLKAPEWQTVLDRLFGTPDTGLIDGTRAFQFRAEDITLTSAQAELFTSIDSPQNLSTLIDTAETLHSKIRLEGTIDGRPFELKLAGRELKIEGLSLTSAQREALVAQLSGIEGLREMKIEALVDGKMTVTKFEGGHEKVEVRGRPDHPRDHDGHERERIEVERHGRDGQDRIEHVRVETPERIEHGGPGRR